MGLKRSLLRLNRSKSVGYFDIVLETLAVLVLVTELCVECTTQYFPSLREVRADPSARGGFFKAFMFIWQGPGIWEALFTSPTAIDRRAPSVVPIIGSMVLLSATGVLYATFAAFLFANRSWRPPLNDVTCSCVFHTQKVLHGGLFLVYVTQGTLVLLLIANHFGMPVSLHSDPLLYLLAMWVCMIVFPMIVLFTNDPRSKNHCKNSDSPSTSQSNLSVENPHQGGEIGGIVQTGSPACAGIVTASQVTCECICCYLLMCVYAVIPLFSTFIWAGLLRCIVAVLGNTAAFTSCIILSCLLIVYSTGRMLGLWMAESIVAWIVRDLMRRSPEHITVEDDRELVAAVVGREKARNWYREFTGLALDFMIVCLLCEVVRDAITSDTTQCLPGMSAVLSYWRTIKPDADVQNVTRCITQNHTLSAFELALGSAGTAVVEAIGTVSSEGMYVVVGPFYAYILYVVLAFLAKHCCGIGKTSLDSTTPDKVIWIAEIHRFRKMEVLVLWYFAKIIVPVYALGFFIPERFHFPGIMMWLLCCAVTFGWKMIRLIVLCAKHLRQLCSHSSRKRLDNRNNGPLNEEAPSLGCGGNPDCSWI